MVKAIAFLVLLIIAPAVYAATYTVGGGSGWTTGFDYVNWASGQNFVVGDTLVFNFDSSHEVDEVNQAAYNGCNTNSRPISSSTSSPTSITLSAAGTRHFICPRSTHCNQGQKLAVTVAAGSTTPGGAPPPSTNGTTPSPPSETPATPGTPETPGTPSVPPPPSSGAASIMGGRSSLMIGFSFVLAALLGLVV